MRYSASDYCTNHPTLSKQLAHWQIVPYLSPTDPRETPPHTAMQEFDSLDELLAYLRLVLADVPHDDILTDFERGEGRPYYTREGYIVDAMHIITLLDSWTGSRPVHMQQWQTLLGNTLRAQRHFAPERAGIEKVHEMMEMLHHPNGPQMAAILGRHSHHPGETFKTATLKRWAMLGKMTQFGEMEAALEYVERMASHTEPLAGTSLFFLPMAEEWRAAGVPPEFAGALSVPLSSTKDLVPLYRAGIPAEYAVACARQGLGAKAIIMGWENGIHPEYAVDL